MADLVAIFRWLETRFHFLFAMVMGLGLAIAPTPVWAWLFYEFIPVFVIFRIGKGWRPLPIAPVIFGYALIAWSIMAILWGYDPSGHGDSALKWFFDGFATLIFFTGWQMTAEQKAGAEWLETCLIYGGTANAVISLAKHIILDPNGLRMWGWGLTGQPVLGAAIMAVLFMLVLDRVLNARGPRWVQICVLCILAAYLLLSGSRNPIFAVAAASAYLLAGQPRRIWLWMAGAGIAILAVLTLLEPSTIRRTAQIAMDRGGDAHTKIWALTVQEILHRPFFGYGPQARLPGVIKTLKYPFPHDLYLSLLFYSGIAGLLLFMGFVITSFRQLGAAQRGRVALCMVPLIAGLTDLSQIIKGPAAIWYIVWVPFLLAISFERKRSETEQLPFRN
jgi:O-antigen ligase